MLASFLKLTVKDSKKRILVNRDEIEVVYEEGTQVEYGKDTEESKGTGIRTISGSNLLVIDSFEEVTKLLGMEIFPRAETIMRK